VECEKMVKGIEDVFESRELEELIRIGNSSGCTVSYANESIKSIGFLPVVLDSLAEQKMIKKTAENKTYVFYKLTKKGENLCDSLRKTYQKGRK
jgi:hypothetical protein